jgi:hypothetical protein
VALLGTYLLGAHPATSQAENVFPCIELTGDRATLRDLKLRPEPCPRGEQAVVLMQSNSEASSPPLSFTAEELSVLCSDLQSGYSVEIVNNTAVVQEVHARLGFLRNADKKVVPASAVCGGLEIKPPPPTIAPGQSESITLSGGTPPTGSTDQYAGFVSVFAASGQASRVPLAIRASASSIVPASPLVTSVKATDYRGDAQESDVDIWVPVDVTPDQSVSFEKGDVVGAVTSENDRAMVTFQELAASGTASLVGLDADDLSAGTYDGKVDLLPDDDGGDVEVALTSKDWWPFALAAVLAGLILAFVVQRLVGVVRPRKRLRLDADALLDRQSRAVTAFQEKARGRPWATTALDIHQDIDALKSKIDRRTAGAWVSIDQKIIDALNTDIESVGLSIDRFPELAEKLAMLMKSLDDQPPLDKMPRRQGPDVSEREPYLATRARGRLVVGPLTAATLAAQFTVIDDALADLVALNALEQEVARLHADQQWLIANLPKDDPDLPKVRAAGKELAALWYQVWNRLRRLDMVDLEAKWKKIEADLSDLWPTGEDRPVGGESLAFAWTMLRYDAASEATPAQPEEATPPSPSGLPETTEVGLPLRSLPQRRELVDELAATRRLEFLAVAVGATLLVIAAMGALYIGKPFGTFWDYVAAITWGLATPTTLVAAGAALNSLGAFNALARRLS